MTDIRTFLQDNTLLFDGGMGVYYAEKYADGTRCEEASLTRPERIREIHREYLAAGARAIKTNTFAANTASLGTSFYGVEASIRAAWAIAQEAIGDTEAWLFADIGPLPGEDPDESEYDRIVDTFLSLGAKHFLLETFTAFTAQGRLAEKIRAAVPDAFVVCSFGVLPEGFTTAGYSAQELLDKAAACPAIDAVGLNCVSGPAHMQKIVARLKDRPALLSVMPNAGYPSVVRGRAVYGGKADYFGARLAELQAMGVKLLGGCCGTTPDFIRAAAEALAHPCAVLPMTEKAPAARRSTVNRLAEKLDAGKRVIALELDPPADDNIGFFVDGARRLRDAGADAITIADCPIARARADSSMLAAKLHRELGLDPIPHMTCRDRNVNATRALLLGLSIEDVHNVLLVTGDPVPTAEREQVKAVFSFNSAVLASYIRTLGEDGVVAPFRVFGALNVNAPNFEFELRKAMRKEESGVSAFLTQPVMTDAAYENLKTARAALKGKILGGIYPIISQRNAIFMNSEIAGIDVPEDVIARYAGLDREQGEDMAVRYAAESAERMMPWTDGWYLMTPFKRVELMERVLKEISKLR